MPGTKDDGTTKVAPIDAPNNPDPGKDTPVVDKDAKAGEPIFGKYKTMEDAEKGHKELESTLGKQGTELASLREKVAASQRAATPADGVKTADQQGKDADYQAKLDDIYAKVESGDLAVVDGIRQSNALTAEMTMGIAINAAGKRTEELLLDKDATAAEAQWHKDYPDYDEVVQSGALQEIISKSPMLIDETVAYFIYKGDQKFEEGQTKAEELAKNAAIADSVEKGPGAQMRTPVRQSGSKMSDIELVNSQMKTLQDFRAGKA